MDIDNFTLHSDFSFLKYIFVRWLYSDKQGFHAMFSVLLHWDLNLEFQAWQVHTLSLSYTCFFPKTGCLGYLVF